MNEAFVARMQHAQRMYMFLCVCRGSSVDAVMMVESYDQFVFVARIMHKQSTYVLVQVY